MQQPSAASNVLLTVFDDTQYYEVDNVNIVRLGRRWFGEEFDFVDQQNFQFKIPNIETSTPISLYIFAAAVSIVNTSMEVKSNDVFVANMPFTPIGSSLKADSSILNTTIPASENIKISLKYNNGGVPDSKGYLDYISLKSKRNLIGYGKQFPFRYDLSSTSTQIGEFQISNASTIKQIWDVSDIYNVTQVTNENQNVFSFKTNFGAEERFIAVDETDYYQPLLDSRSKVANQNLKGTIFF